MNHNINFYKPAGAWREAFPLGNGHIGAMVYGGVEKERIDLTELTFFSGEGSLLNNNEDAATAFRAMRKYTTEEDYASAMKAAEGFIGKRHNYGTSLPVGVLSICFAHDTSDYSDYVRTLDIETGISKLQYKCGSNQVQRECFLSNPDNMLYYHIKSESKPISIMLHFDGGQMPYQTETDDGQYLFFVQARETLHSDGKTGVDLAGRIYAKSADGDLTLDPKGIRITNATDILLCIKMNTDYAQKKQGFCKEISNIENNHALLPVSCPVIPKHPDYETKKQLHLQDFSSFMKRVSLNLNEDPKSALMFQFGRYLLLSSAREDSLLPAHLQGIWNDNVACRIGWTCDMHLDINTQMNYWLSEPGNLAKSHLPLFRWIEELLIPSGRISAKKSYGLPGWSADLVSNPWGYTAPYWAKQISPCPTSGCFAATDYMDHYYYTQDMEFLKEHAYPVLLEAVLFFTHYLFDHEGTLSCGPSISPENSFDVNGTSYYFSNNSTYEVLMIRELFTRYLEACDILGKTSELIDNTRSLLKKLPPYRISADGTIAEWSHSYPSADPQHRHTSHLLGLFPYAQISPEETPELARAAERSIKNRLVPEEGWEDTGWARSMLMLYAARLHHAEEAYSHIQSMQANLTHPNFMVMHPPTRGAGSFQEVYELDGNTGLSMCILEMLLQSHHGVLKLLPALPKAWANGSVLGIIGRGGIEVNLFWKNHRLYQAEFLKQETGIIAFSYQDHNETLEAKAGQWTLYQFR